MESEVFERILSDEFGVEIPDEEIENFHTVGDVVVYVEEHMQ